MRNFVFPKLEWNSHHSRHRSSAARVSPNHRQPLLQSPLPLEPIPVLQSPLPLEPIPVLQPPLPLEPIPVLQSSLPLEPILESSQVNSSQCGDGSRDVLFIRRHSPNGLGSSDDNDSAVPSSSKKPVVEYRRQPRNSAMKASRCDWIAGAEKVEMKVKESEFGNKRSRPLRISIPIGKKNNENDDMDGPAREVFEEENLRVDEAVQEEREEIGVMEVVAEEEREEIGFMEVVAEEREKIDFMEVEEEGKQIGSMVEEEMVAKTWNFRPRKPIRQSLNLNGFHFNYGGWMMRPENPSRKKLVVEKKKEAVKKEESKKRCLTVALTKEEIKEDLAVLGINPSKKPKKRPKAIQKQLDEQL